MISILSFKGKTLRARVTLKSKDLPGVKLEVDAVAKVYLASATRYDYDGGLILEEARLVHPELGDMKIGTSGLYAPVSREFDGWFNEQNFLKDIMEMQCDDAETPPQEAPHSAEST